MAVGDVPFDPWHLVHILWGLLLGVILWLARKVMGDVESLKKEKADKEDIKTDKNEVISRFDELAENNRQLGQRMDDHYHAMNSRFDTLIVSLTSKAIK